MHLLYLNSIELNSIEFDSSPADLSRIESSRVDLSCPTMARFTTTTASTVTAALVSALGLCLLVLPQTVSSFENACDCKASSWIDTLVTEGLVRSATSAVGRQSERQRQPLCSRSGRNETIPSRPYAIRYRYCETTTVSRVYNNDEQDNCFQNPFCENADDTSCVVDNKCNALLNQPNQARCTDVTGTIVGGATDATTTFALQWFGIDKTYSGDLDLRCGLDSLGDLPNCVHPIVNEVRSIDVYFAHNENNDDNGSSNKSSQERLCFSFNATNDEPCEGSCLTDFVPHDDVDDSSNQMSSNNDETILSSSSSSSSFPHRLSVANTGRYNAWVEFSVQKHQDQSGSDGVPPDTDSICSCQPPLSFLDLLGSTIASSSTDGDSVTATTTAAVEGIPDVTSHSSCQAESEPLAFAMTRGNDDPTSGSSNNNPDPTTMAITLAYRYCEHPISSNVFYDFDCRNNTRCSNADEESCTVYNFCHETMEAPEPVCGDFETDLVRDDLTFVVLLPEDDDGNNNVSPNTGEGEDGDNASTVARSNVGGDDLSCGFVTTVTGTPEPLCQNDSVTADSSVVSLVPHTMNVFATTEQRLCFTYDLGSQDAPCRGRCFDLNRTAGTDATLPVASSQQRNAWLEFSAFIVDDGSSNENVADDEQVKDGRGNNNDNGGGGITKTQIVVLVGLVLGILAIVTVLVVHHNNRRWIKASKEIDLVIDL